MGVTLFIKKIKERLKPLCYDFTPADKTLYDACIKFIEKGGGKEHLPELYSKCKRV